MNFVFYFLAWALCLLSLAYFICNRKKFGDEDYSPDTWMGVLGAGALGIVLCLLLLITGCWWLFHN